MTLHTKNMIALSLLGTTIALGLLGLSFSRFGSLAEHGPPAILTPFAISGVAIYLISNWFLVRALTGIQLFGFLRSKRKKRASVRRFSWLLLLVTPALFATPVWVVVSCGTTLTLIVASITGMGLVFFYALVPASDGILALKKFKAEYVKTSKK